MHSSGSSSYSGQSRNDFKTILMRPELKPRSFFNWFSKTTKLQMLLSLVRPPLNNTGFSHLHRSTKTYKDYMMCLLSTREISERARNRPHKPSHQ